MNWSRLVLPAAPPDVAEDVRTAAVAIVFGPGLTSATGDDHGSRDHSPSDPVSSEGEHANDVLLFIRRAERAGDPWSGHIAFPGGHREPSDSSLRAAAERETMEEIGLDLENAAFLGALPVLGPVLRRGKLGIAVAPFVYRVAAWPPLTLSEEVTGTLHFPLRRLLTPEGRGSFVYQWEGNNLDLPSLTLDDAFIWGLTLRMIDDLLARLREIGD